mmetsp:Transcript_96968/g.279047  ORF Transcript_96968/g.279047 Transcript_96968/m.279047 type:complete len:228 (+) Transcript_96968:684-1367(+)
MQWAGTFASKKSFGIGSPVRIAAFIASFVISCGSYKKRPMSKTWAVTPKDQTSTLAQYSVCLSISGAMYGAVPATPVHCISATEPGGATTLASPKSHNLTVFSGPLHMKLSGFTSRCTTRRAWTAASPVSMPRKNGRSVSSFILSQASNASRKVRSHNASTMYAKPPWMKLSCKRQMWSFPAKMPNFVSSLITLLCRRTSKATAPSRKSLCLFSATLKSTTFTASFS